MNNVFPMRTQKGDVWTAGEINRRRPSEGELADRFAEHYNRKVRFWAGKKKWIIWDGDAWAWDRQNLALHLARSICKEAAEAYGDPAIDSHRSVAGVLALAKADPRLAVSNWSQHPDIEEAIAEWLDQRAELDPSAWTPRPELLASFAGWERFDPRELTEAWEARGITYRRKANVHGFSGVRVREAGNE